MGSRRHKVHSASGRQPQSLASPSDARRRVEPPPLPLRREIAPENAESSNSRWAMEQSQIQDPREIGFTPEGAWSTTGTDESQVSSLSVGAKDDDDGDDNHKDQPQIIPLRLQFSSNGATNDPILHSSEPSPVTVVHGSANVHTLEGFQEARNKASLSRRSSLEALPDRPDIARPQTPATRPSREISRVETEEAVTEAAQAQPAQQVPFFSFNPLLPEYEFSDLHHKLEAELAVEPFDPERLRHEQETSLPRDYWPDATGPLRRAHFHEYVAERNKTDRQLRDALFLAASKSWQAEYDRQQAEMQARSYEAELGLVCSQMFDHPKATPSSLKRAETAIITGQSSWEKRHVRSSITEPIFDPTTDAAASTTTTPVKPATFLYTAHVDQLTELRIDVMLVRARARWALADWASVHKYAGRALTLANNFSYPPLLARCRFYVGVAALGRRRFRTARTCFEEAFACKGRYREGGEIASLWRVACGAVEAKERREGRDGEEQDEDDSDRNDKKDEVKIPRDENRVRNSTQGGKGTHEKETKPETGVHATSGSLWSRAAGWLSGTAISIPPPSGDNDNENDDDGNHYGDTPNKKNDDAEDSPSSLPRKPRMSSVARGKQRATSWATDDDDDDDDDGSDNDDFVYERSTSPEEGVFEMIPAFESLDADEPDDW